MAKLEWRHLGLQSTLPFDKSTSSPIQSRSTTSVFLAFQPPFSLFFFVLVWLSYPVSIQIYCFIIVVLSTTHFLSVLFFFFWRFFSHVFSLFRFLGLIITRSYRSISSIVCDDNGDPYSLSSAFIIQVPYYTWPSYPVPVFISTGFKIEFSSRSSFIPTNLPFTSFCRTGPVCGSCAPRQVS